MSCPKCGTQSVDDQSRLCNKCGSELPADPSGKHRGLSHGIIVISAVHNYPRIRQGNIGVKPRYYCNICGA